MIHKGLRDLLKTRRVPDHRVLMRRGSGLTGLGLKLDWVIARNGNIGASGQGAASNLHHRDN
jgi:hypothetical protein